MPTLYKHATQGWEVKYYLHFPDGTHVRKTKKRRMRSEAEAVLSDLDRLEKHSRTRTLTKDEIVFALNMKYITQAEGERLRGGFISADQSWNDLTLKYEAWSRVNCTAYTHRCNEYKLAIVTDAFADIAPEEVTEADVETYLAMRKGQKIASGTINKELVVLRKLLDFVDPEDNPARRVKPLKGKGRKRRPLSPKEMRAFFIELEKNGKFLYGRLKHIVSIYLYAGMRPSEILRLRPVDVDLETMKIYAWETKTNERRTIDIHPNLFPILQDLLDNPRGEYLVQGDKELTGDSISRKIRHLLLDAGINGCTPYSLRHSFVSYLLKNTRDLAYVMKQAGHLNVKTTEGYIDFVEDPESPINKLDFGLQKSATESATNSEAEKGTLH